jgi:hypothetical protein
MSNKQVWSKPQMNQYGSVERITEATNVDVTKGRGTGDSIQIVVNGVVSNVVSNTTGPASRSIISIRKY